MIRALFTILVLSSCCAGPVFAEVSRDQIYNPGHLKPIDSTLNVAKGDKAPDFDLPTVDGNSVSLSQFLGKKNVVLSFVPAAFTPVCSDQWPGYNLAKKYFDQYDAQVIGITTDNTPSQFAWIKQMGNLWFPVASDFWPHGETAEKYGVLRSDGVAERSIFIIDKSGVIRSIIVSDINTRPDLGAIVNELKKLDK
ncbi:peroxiredoxin [Desulfovibrio inopinatus]|uniref:peroxiredoxin n=1 Tax=Desulfovibrio inopinatus TaxID=102109 RepID=UPI0003F833F0|nr:peroxiredoxin [Desulfovibrio inopinatus]